METLRNVVVLTTKFIHSVSILIITSIDFVMSSKKYECQPLAHTIFVNFKLTKCTLLATYQKTVMYSSIRSWSYFATKSTNCDLIISQFGY